MSPAKTTARAQTSALPPEIFDVKVNVPLIHQVVVAQEAAARQGTHAVKTRGEVRGGGKKPYRQKGTGRARQGSTRAPQFAGGGVVHGPQPRSYDQKTPKKMKVAALRGALSDRARHGRVHVVDTLIDGETPKTKSAVAALTALTGTAAHVLVVVRAADTVTWLSLRNAPGVNVLDEGQLNTRDVLVSDHVVFTTEALDAFVSRSLGDRNEVPAAGAAAKAGVAKAEAPEKPKPAKAAKVPEEAVPAETADADEAEAKAAAPAKPKATRAKAKQEDAQ
jgi:large subunit ribosomal protein L4